VRSFQEDAIGIRLRDVIGVDDMMWGSEYLHSESTFPQSRKILAGVPGNQQAKIVGLNSARAILTWRDWPSLLEEPTSLRIDQLGLPPARFAEASRFLWLWLIGIAAGRALMIGAAAAAWFSAQNKSVSGTDRRDLRAGLSRCSYGENLHTV
jgi:hypothetical protein